MLFQGAWGHVVGAHLFFNVEYEHKLKLCFKFLEEFISGLTQKKRTKQYQNGDVVVTFIDNLMNIHHISFVENIIKPNKNEILFSVFQCWKKNNRFKDSTNPFKE